MRRYLGAFAMAAPLLLALAAGEPALAQKAGGILRVHLGDSPPSLSIHEEVTHATLVPMLGVFNNLAMYDQHVPQNSVASIVPELATSWSWNEDGTELTFQLREGVKWHDGRLFTAKDVQCTWELLLGKSQEKLRTNPRKGWYQNVEKVSTEGDFTAIFYLKTAEALTRSPNECFYPLPCQDIGLKAREQGALAS